MKKQYIYGVYGKGVKVVIPKIDPELSRKFRNKVHDHNEFVRLHLVDLNGKDVWSKVCSCMDWLDVAVQGLELPTQHKNMNVTSLRFTHFIVTIDMIFESIKNLWTSFKQATNVKHPYENDSSIFNANEFERSFSDEAYFKKIRAWFGIHAVNGNKEEIEGYPKNTRFFTSWSNSFDGHEFSLRLYSNNSQAERQYGGTKKINVNKIIEFIDLRYNTLYELMDVIDELYYREKQRLQQTQVLLDKDSTYLEQIQQLYKQSQERRLTSEHYKFEVETYISFLKCDLDEFSNNDREIVSEYLNELRKIIPAYKRIIQNVDWEESSVFNLLSSRRSQISVDHHYEFSKILEYAEHEDYPSIGSYGMYKISMEILIDKEILPAYSLSLPGKALSLLIHALDHKWAKEQPKLNRNNGYNALINILDDIPDNQIE